MKQTVKMMMKDRMGVERLLEAEMHWQKDQQTRLSKVRMDFDNPPELRGAAVLVIEKEPKNDMFMYLPELGKTRRITSSMVNGNMMGTDFTYEDFARLQGMLGNLEAERLEDEEFAGHDGPVKRMTVDPSKIEEAETGWFPRAIRMEDLQGGTSTDLVIEKLEIGTKIHRKMFSAAELEKQGRFKPAVTRF
jgi:hypothetical protein